jgi:bifunctional non-homologous end joining protein LigD
MEGPDSLREYRDKRSGERTTEPFGGEVATGAGIFVVQKHAATRLHYDLRLEMSGVLKSWAVPKGISADPSDKKLAVHVEDHPVEYAEFEGIIPEGEYGAGAVIVWDIGRWLPLEDPEEGLKSGKLLFELRGHKLRGVWTLVKIKKSDTGKDWLLIRERKGAPVREDEVYPEESVFSGLTVEQLGSLDGGPAPGEPVRRRLEELGARRAAVEPGAVKLMLAKTRDEAFSDPEWLFELKLDGYRMLAASADRRGLLLTRNGNDATASFPEVSRSLKRLPYSGLVLDGEIVVHDEAGLPSFQRLQKRARLSRPLDVAAASVQLPATYYAFDLLGFEDFDLRHLPLLERKRLLRMVIPPAGPLRYTEHFLEDGDALYEQVQQMRLEGIVAKRADGSYLGGRSGQWLKIHAARTGFFAVVGFTRPKGVRSGFGALHLGVRVAAPVAEETAGFLYAGRVGTGFDESRLSELRDQLEPLIREDAPLEPPFPAGAEHQWVEPELVARVRFKEWTDDGHLRQPVFEELVEMPAHECTREEPADSEPTLTEPVRMEDRSPPVEEIPLSNLDKPFWPEDGFTKGDLIDYYRTIGPWLLPYLEDRPLVLTRYPDGIHGKSFFQKHAPHFAPEWIRTETIFSEGSEREIDYFISGDEATLVYLANLGTIPLHIWSSRLSSLDRPDWCVLDLDPKEAPFSDVVMIARAIHRLCREIDLPVFVKTSGSTGLHILIPLGGQLEYGQSRSLGALLARLIVGELPDIATTERQPARREGKVYIDYLQNGRGRLIVAPYSVRPIQGAPVSAPLRWKEVGTKLEIGQYTIRSMPRRVRALKEDPVLPVLETRPDLLGALERLHARLEDGT